MKKILIVSILICAMLAACQKEMNSGNGIINTVQNDSIYLSKFIALDTTKTAPFDTLTVVYYTYDDLKRVTTASWFGYAGIGNVIDTEMYKYYYNGIDTLPFKSTESANILPELAESTTFYYYQPGTRNLDWDSTLVNTLNLISGIHYLDTFANHYTYFTNTFQTITDQYTDAGHQTFPPFYISLTRQNGNIVSQTDTTGPVENFNCTYDNYKNPFYNVAWYNNMSIVGFYKYYTDSYGLNNNVTEINNTSTSGSSVETSHYKYIYQYRSDGYPVDVIIQDMGSTDPASVNKIRYYYTN